MWLDSRTLQTWFVHYSVKMASDTQQLRTLPTPITNLLGERKNLALAWCHLKMGQLNWIARMSRLDVLATKLGRASITRLYLLLFDPYESAITLLPSWDYDISKRLQKVSLQYTGSTSLHLLDEHHQEFISLSLCMNRFWGLHCTDYFKTQLSIPVINRPGVAGAVL